MSTAIILLAAGESSRLGRPKQLLDFDGVSLIRRVARQLIALDAGPVGVVLGAHRDEIVAKITDLPLTIIDNDEWPRGIGSSIAAGARWANDDQTVERAMVVLCDQPAIDAAHLRTLLTCEPTAAIVATEYAGTSGVPAVFRREVFDRLIALPPDRGAKVLFNDLSLHVKKIAFEAARMDLDTEDDVKRWRNSSDDRN